MQTYSLLIVEDNQADADYLQHVLRQSDDVRFEIGVVGWLKSALTAVAARPYDAVLLDLSLPDSQGLDTVVEFTQAAPEMPIIVMTGHDDMQTGINAVRYGAQDYLIKGDVMHRPLPRAIVYAIERKRADLVGKTLIRQSISSVTGISDAGLVENHLHKVAGFVRDLRGYIAANAPAHLEAFEALITKHQLDVVLREIRALTKPGLYRTRPGMPALRSISETALEAVRDVSKQTIVPPASARDTLLGAIQSSEEIGGRYGADGGGIQ